MNVSLNGTYHVCSLLSAVCYLVHSAFIGNIVPAIRRMHLRLDIEGLLQVQCGRSPMPTTAKRATKP